MEPRGTAATHNARLTDTIAREVSVTADVAPLCYASAPWHLLRLCHSTILIISDHVTLPNIVSLKYRLPVGINSRRGLLFFISYCYFLSFIYLFIFLLDSTILLCSIIIYYHDNLAIVCFSSPLIVSLLEYNHSVIKLPSLMSRFHSRSSRNAVICH